MLGLYLRLAASIFLLRLTVAIPSSSPTPETSSDIPSPTGSSKIFGHLFGKNKQPHIVVIFADDLGWNDVSFHGANQIPTPNIDAIAYNGVILNSHYVSAMCTPSRSALMTGKYPIHTGMQHSVLLETEPRGLPLKEKLLPEYMREAGYRTHAIGKWHLGFFRSEYTPTYRGFDSYFGYYHGFQDYYSHQVKTTQEHFTGFDMRRNLSVAWDTEGKYSTDIFTEEAVKLIEEHDTRIPMFMYMSHLAPHSGTEDDPYQAPDEEIAKFAHIDDPERRTYAAMVSKLDASVGEVVTALRRRGMLDNSIILFMADNGAPTMGIHNNRGSNYPLRGIKDSPWEGAVRGVAAIWSPLIKKTRRVSNQLFSIVDWLPTFWSAAGMDVNQLGNIDGVNIWDALKADKTSPRSEVLINIDDIDKYAAIRRGDFKYVFGHTDSGDDWYGDPGRLQPKGIADASASTVYPDKVLTSKAAVAISGVTTAKQVMTLRQRREGISPLNDDEDFSTKMLNAEEVQKLRREAIIQCPVKKDQEVACNPVESPCLFNIKEDPCERINIAAKRPIVLAMLEEALLKFRVTAIPAANIGGDPLSNPAFWNGVWVSWRDPRPMARMSDPNQSKSSSLSGTTIAVIAIITGLVIVATMTFIAVKYAKRSNYAVPEPERGDLPIDSDEPVSMTELTNNDRESIEICNNLQKLTVTNSSKDRERNIK